MTPETETATLAHRVTGQGPLRVLLLHALTGSPDAAHRPGVKGWWGDAFGVNAPFDPQRTTVWTPNLPGSCYGAQPHPRSETCPLSTRRQAEQIAAWIEAENLHFEVLLGASLGGMVALELAVQAPERFERIGIVGASAAADAWLWGTNHVQRSILSCGDLDDATAIALARQAAMLTFRAPASLDARFETRDAIRDWLQFHGQALSHRFTREAYLNLLDAMDHHDLGVGRGGLVPAMGCLRSPLFLLGIDSDQLFPPALLRQLVQAAWSAGVCAELDWIHSPHGHDAFLIETAQVEPWLRRLLGDQP